MPKDWSRPCGDCGTRTETYDFCEVCHSYVCDACDPTHDCLTDMLDNSDDDGPLSEPDFDDEDNEDLFDDDDSEE
jgi:hypothetical protein